MVGKCKVNDTDNDFDFIFGAKALLSVIIIQTIEFKLLVV